MDKEMKKICLPNLVSGALAAAGAAAVLRVRGAPAETHHKKTERLVEKMAQK